jgi:hypothetical protein
LHAIKAQFLSVYAAYIFFGFYYLHKVESWRDVSDVSSREELAVQMDASAEAALDWWSFQ